MHLDLLTSVFMHIRPRLLSRAGSILGDADEARDALQEAFCKLWGRRESISSVQQAEGLSMVTVRNVCIDNLRRRNPAFVDRDAASLKDVEETHDENDDKTELLHAVERLIATKLTERQRQILYMRDKAGAEISEIADEFDISEANVRMILSRARKTVRDCYLDLNRKQ